MEQAQHDGGELLPKEIQKLFWEYEFDEISLQNNRDLVINRVLTSGNWDAILWLRDEVGDSALKNWIVSHDGADLTPRQLRFWQIICDLPKSQVDTWIAALRSSVWGQRRA